MDAVNELLQRIQNKGDLSPRLKRLAQFHEGNPRRPGLDRPGTL